MVDPKKALFRGTLTVAVLLMASACAPTKTPEQVVQERSTARWEAIMARDYGSEYALHSPGFRSIKSENAHIIYRSSQPVRWTAYDIQGVTCESAEVCEVVVKVDYEVRSQISFVGVQEFFSNITETWVFTDGAWFYLPKELEK